MITVTAEIVSNLIEVTAEIVSISIGGGGGASGTYQIFVNGVLNQSGSSSDLTIETFNITA